ncbi:hypothetical protein B0H15DRAFT_944079 [Mycena belliarum]|uniref:Uncharacterized protein n=1 Tax=Mycena belliarum TaxID=1033014 RepID=A0AAD6XSU9_9AGAR|nr:hypothetical protein B0H15DRAFT_944079 [Mycena belliae]
MLRTQHSPTVRTQVPSRRTPIRSRLESRSFQGSGRRHVPPHRFAKPPPPSQNSTRARRASVDTAQTPESVRTPESLHARDGRGSLAASGTPCFVHSVAPPARNLAGRISSWAQEALVAFLPLPRPLANPRSPRKGAEPDPTPPPSPQCTRLDLDAAPARARSHAGGRAREIGVFRVGAARRPRIAPTRVVLPEREPALPRTGRPSP